MEKHRSLHRPRAIFIFGLRAFACAVLRRYPDIRLSPPERDWSRGSIYSPNIDYEGPKMDNLSVYNAVMERAFDRKSARGLERHHLLPLCLGGNREAANEVWLTPREHILAHALLLRAASATRRPVMLASLVSTINAPRQNSAATERARCVYARAVSEQAALHAGNRHHNHRHDIHRIQHTDGRSLHGTRLELIAASGVPFRRMYDVINGRRPQAHGWRLI